jgi:ribonuclease HI
MKNKKQKYYVVWQGKRTGVFTDWKDCEAQIKGVVDARFKSFESLTEAEEALKGNYWDYVGKDKKPTSTAPPPAHIGYPNKNSIAVDAAWNTSTGVVEYQGVHIESGEKLFAKGPYQQGTNNIGEFLAIIHALAYLKQHKSELPIYTDSKTALSWLKRKHANTKLEVTEANKDLFELLQRAERWLADNTYTNKVLKWETEYWGENPADFGRK